MQRLFEGFGKNKNKIILSLFDNSLEWCKPYIKAGYTVIPFDIQKEGKDILETSDKYFAFDLIEEKLNLKGYHVYGILIAIPCCNYAVSGARWFKEKDADGRTEHSQQLLKRSMEIVNYFSDTNGKIADYNSKEAKENYPDAGLNFWVLENPVSRINSLNPFMAEFGPSYFQPFWYGSPWTKKTGLWGKFCFPLPTNIVEPTQGSKMWKIFPTKNPIDRKNERSKTDSNFANAFHEVNQ